MSTSEVRNHLVRGAERDSGVPPGARASRHTRVVEPARRVFDEPHPEAPVEETTDRRIVADVGRDAEDDDLVRIQPLEEALRVGIREDVEALFQEQEITAVEIPIRKLLEGDRHRIDLLRLSRLARAARSTQAMR